jgi:hypothetical protein
MTISARVVQLACDGDDLNVPIGSLQRRKLDA